MNPIGRAALLYGIILPFRPRKSAAAYRKIWGKGVEAGVSPLLAWTQRLAEATQASLGEGWKVSFGMRYGRPNLATALAELQQHPLKELVVLPLYPQYASSSTGSTLQKVIELVKDLPVVPPLKIIRDFYDDPGFVASVAAVARPGLETFKPDHVLFSFHGLPERQVSATQLGSGHCLASTTCCDRLVPANHACYRAQSFATARLVAAELGLDSERWSVSFQSRLTKIPWIKPYTDVVLEELAQKGVKRLAVLTPSFVADCLETLEEIGIRAEEDFKAAGGDALFAVPCVNVHPRWVESVSALVRNAIQSD